MPRRRGGASSSAKRTAVSTSRRTKRSWVSASKPHAPHRHVHEEIIIVVEGSVETYNEGRTQIVEAGSVIFYGSNQMHSARNAGKVPARYYVIELRGDE